MEGVRSHAAASGTRRAEGVPIHWLVRLVLLIGLGGCSASAVPSDATVRSAMPVIGSRYAVQWHGYIGEQVGMAVRPHLAFVDVFDGGARRHDPAFDDVILIGDDGDAVPAIVVLVGTGFENDAYRAVNVDLEVTGLDPGTHRFTAMRYRDEHGVRRQLSIGTYIVEIVHRQADDLSIWEAEVGSGRFERLGVVLQNDLDAPLIVEGLRFALPGLPVRTTMRGTVMPAETAPAGTASGAPIPAPSAAASTSVEFAAGERRMLEFEFSGADPRTFVVLQPLVRYVRADGSAGLLPLVPHRYAPGFASPSEVEQFVSGVPDDGAHHLHENGP